MKYLLIIFLSINTFLYAQGPIEDFFEGEYKDFDDYKAFAVAINDSTGAWALGQMNNAPTQTVAKNVALKNCKKSAEKYKVNRKCKLYAVGDKKVYSNY
ncbi:hypothetical protein ACMC56_13165 [Campylobacterota bacterium DY0563]